VVYAVRQAGEGLEVSVAGQPPLPLLALEPDVLRAQYMTLRFERDASGLIIGLQLDAGRVKNLRFTRVRE